MHSFSELIAVGDCQINTKTPEEEIIQMVSSYINNVCFPFLCVSWQLSDIGAQKWPKVLPVSDETKIIIVGKSSRICTYKFCPFRITKGYLWHKNEKIMFQTSTDLCEHISDIHPGSIVMNVKCCATYFLPPAFPNPLFSNKAQNNQCCSRSRTSLSRQ